MTRLTSPLRYFTHALPLLGLVGLFGSVGAGCKAGDPPAPIVSPPPTIETRVAGSETPADRGAAHYAKYCALCHGAELEGYAADNAPSLVSPTFAATAEDEFLRVSIELGRPGTAMAGFGDSVGGPLNPGAIADLIAFIRARGGVPQQKLEPYPVGGDATLGARIYGERCAVCHGTATQRSSAVHLANPLFVKAANPSFIAHAIVHGRPGTRMEPFAAMLDEKAVQHLVAYIRGMAAAVPLLPPISPPQGPPPVPAWTPIPLNPRGGTPNFTLREGRFVPMDQVHKALKDGKRLIIVDARPPSDWISLHITGSVSLPYYDKSLIDRIPNDGTWIVAYCGCPHHVSGEVVDELRRRGYPHAAVLDEGIFPWQQKGYPVVAQPGMAALAAPPPVVPQPAPPPAASTTAAPSHGGR